jgi:hypothetical protein
MASRKLTGHPAPLAHKVGKAAGALRCRQGSTKVPPVFRCFPLP